MEVEQKSPCLRLEMRGITKSFGATRALGGVNLEIRAGEVHALVGENGAGKSTLMKVLSGAHAPDGGEMFLEGTPYRPSGPAAARNQGVGMIYQELSLAPHLSVAENVLLGMEPVRRGCVDWNRMDRLAQEALATVGLGDLPPRTRVGDLPIAPCQLVEIARAMALDCRVLVLDEPTSSLGKEDTERLFALVRRLRDEGMSIIYISHFMEEITALSDRLTVLRDGQTVVTADTASMTPDDMIAAMVGRDVKDLYPRSPHPPAEKLLEVSGLSGRGEVPDGVSFSLHRGEVFGLFGLVGSGRTELMRALFGLDAVESGEVTLAGAPATHTSPRQRWRQGVGMVSENRKEEGLALGWSIADNITLPRLRGLGPGRLVTPAKQREASLQWVKALSIKCASPAQAVGALSGGNQQKAAIARLLHAEVDVLLLDEPTRGVDVGAKAQIYQLIDQWACGDPSAGREARAVLVISSYLPELMGICDRVGVMCRGQLTEVRPVEDWTEHEIMRQATGHQEKTI